MSVETATYISEFNPALPAHTDGLQETDSHMRLIKGVLQAQFPNFTAAALTSTNANIDLAVAAANGGTVKFAAGTLALPGIAFSADTDTGFYRPSANSIVGVVGGAAFLTAASNKDVTFGGSVTAGGTGFIGKGTAPIGSSMIWWSNTLPDEATWGTYLWCNGEAVGRTTYAELFDIIGTTYGAGNGSTFNLPDLRDNVPVGRSTMGGAADAARLDHVGITGMTSGAPLGQMFGKDHVALTIAQMPAHDHGGNTGDEDEHTHGYEDDGTGSQAITSGGGNAANVTSGNKTTDPGSAHHHSISSQGSGDTHQNVQPSIFCNWIIRAK